MEFSDYPVSPILMVDDEEHALIGVDTLLRSNGISNIICCADSRDVSSILAENDIGLILLDLFMPHVSGEEILGIVGREYPHIPVIVITGADTVESAVMCIKSGAFDYLVKPLDEGRLITSVMRALEFRELQSENSLLKKQLFAGRVENPDAFAGIVTNDERMKAIFRYSEAIAESPMPVLITGETGTGKELLVQCIHRLSRAKGKLVKINVAGLDDNMFSDTLFGHKKGAFTGAEIHRAGLLGNASGGTLFLDEIGELSVPSQVKLLRLLQNREYYSLGSDEPAFSDARIIVATNVGIEELCNRETFRKDLYYRLRTHHIHLPSLKERAGDMTLLLDYFLEEAAEVLNRKKPTVPEEMVVLLETYNFPGNVRELQSMVFDALSKHESGILSMESFREYVARSTSSQSNPPVEEKAAGQNLFSGMAVLPTLKHSEAELIEEALKRSRGNQSIAAGILGISRQALNRRIKARKPAGGNPE